MTDLSGEFKPEEEQDLRQELARVRELAEVSAAMLDAGVRNADAAKGVLEEFISENRTDEGDVPGLREKLKEMSESVDTAFLFKSGPESRYVGKTHGEGSYESQIESGELSYEAELSGARESGDFLRAIDIKRKAAKDGVILI